MIQKRYQYWSGQGITWSGWFNYYPDNGQLQTLRTEEKWQLKNKLLNEFRIVTNKQQS